MTGHAMCVCVQMSEAGSDAENMDPVPDNSGDEGAKAAPKEPEPAPKRRRLGKLQKAK